jgi:hypothetical protein
VLVPATAERSRTSQSLDVEMTGTLIGIKQPETRSVEPLCSTQIAEADRKIFTEKWNNCRTRVMLNELQLRERCCHVGPEEHQVVIRKI